MTALFAVSNVVKLKGKYEVDFHANLLAVFKLLDLVLGY